MTVSSTQHPLLPVSFNDVILFRVAKLAKIKFSKKEIIKKENGIPISFQMLNAIAYFSTCYFLPSYC